ncbi:MAG: hypothetical protein ACP5N1_02875 [Candidatus Woesearchaeota archaeon]
MKIYIASRLKDKNFVSEQIDLLKKHNHIFLFDWTSKELNLKPYSTNNLSKEYSNQIHNAIVNTDIFILISDVEGQDMFIELGIALESLRINGKPKIFIVGANKDLSMMHNHSAIQHVANINEIYALEKLI